jgi:hypothetical protein
LNGRDDFGISLGDMMRGERASMGKSLLDVQKELKIKAAYIAAIENADASAFETPGFISGYVRSYARYLDMDPDDTFKKFIDESGYRPVGEQGTSGSIAHRAQYLPAKSGVVPARRGIFEPYSKPFADIEIFRSKPKKSNKWLVASGLAGAVTSVLVYLSEITVLQAEPGLHAIVAFLSGVTITIIANMFNPVYFFARAAYFFFAPVFAASFFGVNISLTLEGELLGGFVSVSAPPNPVAMIVCGTLAAFALFFHHARTRD